MNGAALDSALRERFDGIEATAIRPDFLVVGAQKAGTSTLHAWLKALPGIRLPRDKETHYLTHVERSEKGAGWYLNQFPLEAASDLPGLVGEVDPELLHHPAGARRVRALFGAPRIVVLLRDPLERARSQHAMSQARGLDALAFAESLEVEQVRLRNSGLDSPSMRHHGYLERSRYARDIGRYLEEFGSDGILIVRFEDLFTSSNQARRLETFAGLLRFIGYRGQVQIEKPEDTQNGRWEPRSQWIARFLHGDGVLRNLLGKAVPSEGLRRRIGQLMDAWNRNSVTDPSKGELLEDRWHRNFLCEIEQVEVLTGWDCRSWKENLVGQSATSSGGPGA